MIIRYPKLKLHRYNHEDDDHVREVQPSCLYNNTETTKTKSSLQKSHFVKLYAGGVDKFRVGLHEVSVVVDRLSSFKTPRHSTLRCMSHRVENCTECEFVTKSNDCRIAFNIMAYRYKHAHRPKRE